MQTLCELLFFIQPNPSPHVILPVEWASSVLMCAACSLPGAVSEMDGGVHLLGLCGLERTAGNTYVKRAAH
ncbi:MAG: hypothetical protein U0I51_18450 [Muricomes sp.]|uniref:hypothetical protein n=1 Tax=Faecalicatena contorta TaxID=39482 RepID=UPI002EC03462|nr:hypothetical protein [Muricomes sp.]